MADDGGMSAPVPTGRRTARLSLTLRDMVWSMAVVLGVVALLLIVTWRPQPDPIRVVDGSGAIAFAAVQSEVPVLAPQGLADQWRLTSARWEPTEESLREPVLHLGYVTPGDEYAQVTQSVVGDEAYVAEQTDEGRVTGVRAVAGREWEQRESDRRRSLVATIDGATVIVTGTAEWVELESLVGSLTPYSAS